MIFEQRLEGGEEMRLVEIQRRVFEENERASTETSDGAMPGGVEQAKAEHSGGARGQVIEDEEKTGGETCSLTPASACLLSFSRSAGPVRKANFNSASFRFSAGTAFFFFFFFFLLTQCYMTNLYSQKVN